MEKRGVVFAILMILLAILVSSCSQYLPVTLTICGDMQCGYEEETTCPSDCTNISTTTDCLNMGGTVCNAGEMCPGYSLSEDWCCSEACVTQITQIDLVAGKNYVSLPYVELNDNVEDIIPADVLANVESLYYYDCQEGTWLPYHTDQSIPSDPDFKLIAGHGYVFKMAADDTLLLSDIRTNMDAIIATESQARSPQNVPVCTGWNFVASSHGVDLTSTPLLDYFWNFNEGTYSIWHMHQDGAFSDIDLGYNHFLIPTYTYWFYATEDGEIVP
jgi:hypothetical protein